MSTKTQFSVSDIAKAKITGKSSQTVRRELKNRQATTHAKGKSIYVELSELMRIYTNDELDFLVLSDKSPQKNDTPPTILSESIPSPQPDNTLEIELLKEKLNSAEKQIEQYQGDIDYLKQTIDKALENQNKTMLLLEHQSQKETAKPYDFSKLEERIAKQEEATKSSLDKTEKLEQDKKALIQELKKQKAVLAQEKNKGFFQRLFG